MVFELDDWNQPGPIAYIVKRYPRFSETFIVNEILEHERAGQPVKIFALRPPTDTHFQDVISKVRAPVKYLTSSSVKGTELWRACQRESELNSDFFEVLQRHKDAAAQEIFQGLELAQLIRRTEIQHLHAHFATSASTVACLAAELTGSPFSFTAHAKDIFHESVVDSELCHKIESASAVITVSEFNRNFLINRFGHPEKIHRIYNGLDLDVFRFHADRNPQERRIVSVGRLVEKKGFDVLINACRLLADRGIHFQCEIIGGGELEGSLREQIERLDLESEVNLTGPLPQSEVRRRIVGATVFAAPCVIGEDGNRDGLPTVLTESIALGTPCIATDVTGIPELVRDQQTGIIVSQHDAAALADQMQRLLGSPSLCKRFATAGRELIQQAFDARENAAALRMHFNSTLADQSNVQRQPLEVVE